MINFFLRRPVLTNLITLFLLVVGGYQFFHVRREAFPEIDFDIVVITTLYPGASPEEVERLVTTKIEEQLRPVAGIEKVFSSSLENRSVITVRLDEDLSKRQIDRAINDIEQGVNRVTDFPAEVDRPVVQELTSDRPLITLSVAGGDEAVRRHFSEELADVVEDLAGVSRVEKSGYKKREIWIEADRRRLNEHRLTLAEVAAAVRARNTDVSAGTVEVGTQELWVRVTGSVLSAAEVGNFILRGNDSRQYLRIKDVAEVTERFEEPRFLYRANGLASVDLNIRKLRSGDTIRLAKAVRDVQAKFTARARAQGLTLVASDDWSFFIKRRLSVMTNNLVQGGILILAALFLFLDWRLALVAALGVPLSFAAAFALAVPLGFTINLMSLLAFIIVLGMLDDDSVVVAENIYRHLEMGKAPIQAALDGTREVVVPVLASVASTSAAFLPFALVTGIMGKFLLMIPIIVVLAFLASAFEAFFILPGHVAELVPFGKPITEESEARGWFRHAQNGFRFAVSWAVHHRFKFLLLMFAVTGATVLIARHRLKFVLFPAGLVDQFFVQLDMPEGTHLKETERAMAHIEQAVLKSAGGDLEALTSNVGLKGFEQEMRAGTSYAQARVFLTPEEKRKRKTKTLIADLREQLKDIPGGGRVVFEELRTGPPVGKAVQVLVRGRDPAVIGRIVDEVKRDLASWPGVRDLRDSREGGKVQMRVVLNPREAAFAGLTVAGVAQNILYAVDGGEASVVRRESEQDEIKIRVRLQPDQRTQAQELLSLDVLNPQGRPVRLGAVARVEKVRGPPSLERYNFRPAVTVSADVDTTVATSREINLRLKNEFKNLSDEFPGYELVYGGEEEETNKSLRSLYRAFGVAIFLDFVVLAAIFKSYVQPFMILLSIPIGMLGVVWALLLHNQPVSFMALLGVVAMTGVVVNNGIVLVSFINQRREEGQGVKEAAVEGAVVRLRPIFASSVTTLLGLLPTAYGKFMQDTFGMNGYEPFVSPMALALAWGLMIAMPMTLFLMPTAYVLIEDARSLSDRAMAPLARFIDGIVKRIAGATSKEK
ncbi:MAG: efflux RND transporter permease subunit [Elusimicrobia bacterium]|nr:efflux RND transporter permease subunit [Elusimicrobiota bacterium]